MEFIVFIDFKSVIFVIGGALLIASTQKFGKASLVLLDDLIIPLGIIGTLIGFIAMLGAESDLKGLPKAALLALAPLFYALAIKGFVNERPSTIEAEVSWEWKTPGFLGLVFLIVYAMHSSVPEGLTVFIDLPAIIYIISSISLFAVSNLMQNQSLWTGLQQRIVDIGLFGFMVGILLMLADFFEPKSLGPSVAFSYLSLMYAMLILVSVRILRPDTSWREYNHSPISWNSLGLPFFLGLLISVLLLLVSLSNSDQ